MSAEKISFRGTILAVQPRIRLLRSFDERSHNYLGYALLIQGEMNGVPMNFSVGIGKAAQKKHGFEAGFNITGDCQPVLNPALEPVEFYKASKLAVTREDMPGKIPPPWLGIAPDLETYRSRGHRRLSAVTYEKRCSTCIWGCRMPVEIILDQWNTDLRKYRFETFCYGPLSCPVYKAGPNRKVEGRNGMIYEEDDWVDEDATQHRHPEE